MIMLKALAFAVSVTICVSPAFAACVVDYETFEVRDVNAADHVEIVVEQAAWQHGWYQNNETITLPDLKFEKYGLDRVVSASDLEFWGFVGSVPFMIEAGASPEAPEIIYGSVNPSECTVQPYLQVR